MDRRTLLKRLGGLALIGIPFSTKFSLATGDSPQRPILILIHDSTTPGLAHQQLLEHAEPYLTLQNPKWHRRFAIWDVQTHAKEIREFVATHGRNTAKLSLPMLVRIPAESKGTEDVEIWTPAWVRAKQGFTDACYPISGSWWSVDGDFDPTMKKVFDHIHLSPNHTDGKFQLDWLTLLSFEELQSLHSDHHREMTKAGKVHWKNVNEECAAPAMTPPLAWAIF